MGLRFCLVSMIGVVLLAVGPPVQSQTIDFGGDQHPWARFGVGSWKLVRMYTETLDPAGKVEGVSTTETKTTLEQADDQSYTLKVEVTVEVAGRRFTAEPKHVTYGLHGELKDQSVEITALGEGKVEINGEEFPTSVRKIVINGGTTKSVSTVHYCQRVAPHILQRKTQATDNETMARSYESEVEVMAVEMPAKVLSQIMPASHIKTIETYANGTSKATLEVHCEQVPGGVVSHSSKQMNSDGLVTHRSTLELVEYEAVPKPADDKTSSMPPRRGVLKRRRSS